MVNYLYPPTASPPPFLGTSSGSTHGNVFYTASSGVSVWSLGWYRQDTAGPAPTALKLRDQVAGTILATITPADDGTIGWHYTDLSSGIALTANREYLIFGDEPSGMGVAEGSHVTPDSPFSWENGVYGNSGGVPGNVVSVEEQYSVADAVVNSSTNPTTGTSTLITVAESNDDWFSSSSSLNKHQSDGVPWQVWQRVQQIVSNGGDITTSDVTTYGLSARTVGAGVAKLLAYALEHSEEIAQVLSWLGVGAKPAESATVPDQLTAILNAALGSQGVGYWSSGQVLDPLSHTEVDSFPFTGRVGWGSGYALHRIHVDTVDDKHPFEDLGAAGFFARALGWWAPIMPGGIVGSRTWLEWSDQWCWPVPEAATGIVVYVHPAVSGTIYAYSVA